jgi:hypothetical protein
MDNSIGNNSMRGLFHYDRLAEKLELARTIGFVSDYFVGPTGPAHRPELSVRLCRRSTLTGVMIRDYLVRLLDGVGADYEIIVTPAIADA